MAFQTGDIVLVPYPFTDQSSSKARPAVIISGELYNLEHPDLVLGALTTNVLAANGTFDYVLKDWQTAALRFESAFKPLIATLDRTLILHSIGRLSQPDFMQIVSRVRQVFER